MPSRMAEIKGSLPPGAHTDLSSARHSYAWNTRH
jgi:hypothetical protein